MAKEKDIVKAIRILKEKSRLSMLGELSNEEPFYVLISTVLSARNRDEMTAKAVKKLFSKYKTPKQIANAPLSKLEPLIKQSGFYRTKARRIKEISRILIEKYKGKVPDDFDELVSLPGVGRKTAGCVMVYAFNKPAIPVDTHVHRISNRLGWVNTKTREQTEQELMRIIPKKYWLDVNEVLVIHGQTTCKPIRPWCDKCKITLYCDYFRHLTSSAYKLRTK
ncbi:endonuclease III [Candidatus Woesearchaeota archaeon]|nr:endonuclease III [Candidatus Woesearchaeota archaeon]